MKTELETININGVEYVRKDSIPKMPKKAKGLKGMEYKIIRTYSAGVFAGYVEKRKDKDVTIRQARRLWYWSGAASLSQLANEGVKKPADCKFPAPVDKIEVTEAIEILDVTEKARLNIAEVPEWKK